MGRVSVPEHMSMDLDSSPLAGLANDPVETLAIVTIRFTGLVKE